MLLKEYWPSDSLQKGILVSETILNLILASLLVVACRRKFTPKKPQGSKMLWAIRTDGRQMFLSSEGSEVFSWGLWVLHSFFVSVWLRPASQTRSDAPETSASLGESYSV